MNFADSNALPPASPPQSVLLEGLSILRRRFRVLLGCVLAGPVAALVAVLLSPNEYTSTSALLFRTSAPTPAIGASSSSLVGSSDSSGNPLVDQATDLNLIGLQTLDRRTALVIRQVSAHQVQRDISISPTSNSNVVLIAATTPNPGLSQLMANTFTQQFVAFRQQIDSASYVAAERNAQSLLARMSPAQRIGPAGRSLEAQAQTLSLEASLQSGNVEIVQRAERSVTPSSPRKFRDLAMGLLAGLVAGIVGMIFLDRMDRKIRTVDEFAAAFDCPVLGTVPVLRDIGGVNGSGGLRNLELEPFHLILASLAELGDPKTLLVTSAQSGDGKSTVAHLLALAAASAGRRVLLVDADLRRNGRFSEPIGLAQVLSGSARLEEVIITVSETVDGNNEVIAFDVVPSGALNRGPAELFGGDLLPEVAAQCKRTYDLVLYDTPPLTVVSDAVLISRSVPTILAVGRIGTTDRVTLARFLTQLRFMHANVSGMVVNAVPKRFAYAYGYDEYSQAMVFDTEVPIETR